MELWSKSQSHWLCFVMPCCPLNFDVTINKLWCLLFVCGYWGGRRVAGGRVLEGWYLGCEVWMFLQEMWRIALCKKGKELQRHDFTVHRIEVLEFCIIVSTLSQYAHNFTVYPVFFILQCRAGWKVLPYCMQHVIYNEPMKKIYVPHHQMNL